MLNIKCVAGEKISLMATLFAIEFSCDQDPNDINAWSDFFGVVAATLIAISNRKIYQSDPNSKCQKKQQSADTQTTTSSSAAAEPKKCSR